MPSPYTCFLKVTLLFTLLLLLFLQFNIVNPISHTKYHGAYEKGEYCLFLSGEERANSREWQ